MLNAQIKTDSSIAAGGEIRLLVVIASFGDKNLAFLEKIIQAYQAMSMRVDVIVVSNAPKNLGPTVKVVVGLPSSNPWSLPFAHKPIFAENVDKYDLFIYSEDDMAVTEKNIQAFLQITPRLEADEIAGYLRYEHNPSGAWSLPEAHGVHHWKPESVRRRGNLLTAEFSNEHAAFYILNQAQLKQAIASGGFLLKPYAGHYDMLCSAATDPYTNCGFRKVICVSALDDFLIHHLPNRYAGQFGVSLPEFREHIEVFQKFADGEHASASLGISNSKQVVKWAKAYYEPADVTILNLIPRDAKTILSIGCGWGEMEATLKQRGIDVTALPLDSVIGSVAARRGVKVAYGTLEEGLAQLAGQKFDCVLITNLLHLFPKPATVVKECANMVQDGGTLLVTGPNFNRMPVLVKRILRMGNYGLLRDYRLGGVSIFSLAQLSRWARQAGLRPEKPVWIKVEHGGPVSGAHSSWEVFRRKLFRKLLKSTSSMFNAEGWILVSKNEQKK